MKKVMLMVLAWALATGPALAQQPAERQAKQAVDDRGDPNARGDDVGKGTRMGRQPLKPGAYFNDRHRAAVHDYYASHATTRPPGQAPHWTIGEPVPAGAKVKAVPKPVLALLPPLPPGHRYVQLADTILLIAAGSRMVVDAIAAGAG